MSEWLSVTLSEISTQRKGINYKSEDYGEQHSGHPFLTIKCFVKGGGYEPTGIKFYDGFSTRLDHLRAGDILFSVTDLTRAGDIVGSPLKVPDFGGDKPPLASMDCMRIEPITARCDKDFLFHRLMLSDVRRQMIAYSAGSTVLHLDTKKTPTITVRIPVNKREQAKIAAILNSLDMAIEKTEALIAKYQQIKAGLLHDLFTRGVTADGKLRPPRKQAPELYKETPIGWIPKEWDVVSLSMVSEFITSGSRGWADYYDIDGALFIRIGNLTREHPNFRWDSIQKVRLPKCSEGTRTRVSTGDILISITADLGISAVASNDLGEAYVNQHIALVRPLHNLIDSRYLGHFLGTKNAQFQFQRLNDSGAKAGLNLPAIGRYLVPKPKNKDEAMNIRSILDSVDTRVNTLRKDHENLRMRKVGLMTDLLTGKVRVKPDANTPEMAVG